jgi:putative transcriptional regulator
MMISISYKMIFIYLMQPSDGISMIRIHLSRLLGENKEKLADLIRSTGLARNTVTGLYRETTARIDTDTLNAICRHYDCTVADLLEYVPDGDAPAGDV